ncbi:endoribonuclease Dicer-like [Aphidius gifuensis]|uniref:endoribonuclease Dicer-like n=1 Tax=Aphidius gifuensis TaxID=684658 RepID=UPI001CDB69E2|nr:endoribonuclease Dicer-like [Aphidius gifuensis]
MEDEFTARPYQIDLYEKAIAGNTIIYLPTGSGKTYIAAMLIKAMSQDVRADFSKGGKRTIFIVNTVPLVEQQSIYISKYTDLTCQGYSGDMSVVHWSKNQWFDEFEKNQVLVMTAQIFVDILQHSFMSLKQVNLIIFDECHHAVKDHPMRQIMKEFEHYEKHEQPKVLGLSATLLNSNVKEYNINETIEFVETTFHSKVITIDSMVSVIGYARVTEKQVFYDDSLTNCNSSLFMNIFKDMTEILQVTHLQTPNCNQASSVIFQPKSTNRRLMSIVLSAQEHYNTMGLYGGSTVLLLHLIQLLSMEKNKTDSDTSSVIAYLITKITVLRKLMEFQMDEKIYSTNYQRITDNSSDKLIQLLSLLKEYWINRDVNKKFCCIIFVARRFTAKVLYHILNNVKESNEDFNFLKPDYMTGYSNDPYKNVPESMCIAKWNNATLENFRQGVINCLIATDVADEGIDIPACSLIIRYNAPYDFRSYVQSKGRARDSSCLFVILMGKNDSKLLDTYSKWKKVENLLKCHLTMNADERIEPIPEDIINKLYASEIKPYTFVSSNGNRASLTDISAIALVNRYCSSLRSSKFVTCTPTLILHKVKGDETTDGQSAYWVSLQLPLVSPLRHVINGDVMRTRSLAKRSVAMKACIQLHKIGELNDKLLPRDVDDIVQDITVHLRNWKKDKMIIDTCTAKHHELYQISSFFKAQPQPNSRVFLHVINVKPAHSIPSLNRHKVFYNYLNNDCCYAILSSKKLLAIPSFPIYMQNGQLNVDIAVNHSELILTSSDIDKLKNFHWIIFNDILDILKKFLVFDNDNLSNNYFIVPVNEQWKINWDLIEKYKKVVLIPANECTKIDDNVSSFDFSNTLEENWQIVKPSYRSSHVYIVTKICHDMNPLSPFLSETKVVPNYFEYFKKSYQVEVTDMKQPLLEVKPISKNMNFILPKIEYNSGKIDERNEYFIPELCNVIQFPAVYWLKATSLPSILHRINQLLVADELRCQIVRDTGMGIVDVEKWPPLEFTEQEKNLYYLQQQQREKIIDADDEEEIINCDEKINLTIMEKMKIYPSTCISDNIDNIDNIECQNLPWQKEQEPINLEKNINAVQLVDIEYYNKFIKNTTVTNEDILKSKSTSIKYSSRPKDLITPILKIINIIENNNIGPSPVDIMYALTPTYAGDTFNLERLETLGDSYLKFITCMHLYETYSAGEGRLTMYKDCIVGNRNLYYSGNSKMLAGKLKMNRFEPNGNFITPSFCTPTELQSILRDKKISSSVLYEIKFSQDEQQSGNYHEKLLDDEFINTIGTWEKCNGNIKNDSDSFIGVQFVKDKCVSDSVEALTAIYLNQMGLTGAAKLLKWFGVLPDNMNINKILNDKPSDGRFTNDDPLKHMNWIDSIESSIGYKFNNKIYLLQAFTHSSYSGHVITCDYQRLEFLGDAVIDFLITVYIYENCGNLSPGDLTDLRSALVNNITFACLSVKYRLHTAILQYSIQVNESIEKFVNFQLKRNFKIDDELLWVLYEEDECNISESVEVPKILADVFESLIGAIYLDTNKNLNKVWEILYGLMHDEIDKFSKNVPKQPVRVIFETTSINPKFYKAEKLAIDNNTMVPLRITVAGENNFFYGFGKTSETAKRAAAKQALKFLRKNKLN